MYKYILIVFFTFFSLLSKSNAQILTDSLLSQADTSVIVERKDTSIFSKRLDSLNSEVPLVYNLQVNKYINAYLSRKKDFGEMLDRGQYLFPIFEKALNNYQIPICFKFLPIVESSMNSYAVSKSGAVGLWQFMYQTGLGYKLEINDWNDERKDPTQSSYAAAKYFKDAYNELGDWLLVLAAYNCGTGAVKKAISKAGGCKDYWKIQPYLSKQTQNYVPAFIAATYLMSYPTVHDIYSTSNEVITALDSIYIYKKVNLKKIEEELQLPLNLLSNLNPSFKKGIIYASLEKPRRLILPPIDKSKYQDLYKIINSSSEITNYGVSEAPSNLNISTLVEEKMDIVKSECKPKISVSAAHVASAQDYSASKNEVSENVSYINYTVKMGDTLLKIANKFRGLTVDRIKEINRLSSSILKIGTILKLVEFDKLSM